MMRASLWSLVGCVGLLGAAQLRAQAIDSSAVQKQTAITPAAALPGEHLDSDAVHPAEDSSSTTSARPGPYADHAGGQMLRLGTALTIKLTQPISSGVQRNGQTVRGQLAAPVRTTGGTVLPRGTAVTATVVSAAAAGVISSGGVLSLQLTHVGHIAVVTDVRDFNGAEGHKDVADSAPAKGAEAVVAAGTPLHFKVLQMGHVPGVVPGVAPSRNAGGGNGTQNGGQNGQTGTQSAQPSTQPSTQPGVSQRPVPGATTGVVPGNAPQPR